METINVTRAPKTGTFQMRINPTVKDEMEKICADCGMTMTDAINIFLQQTINARGLPFIVTRDTREALRQQAIDRLLTEIQAGRDSVRTETDWVSEEEMLARFGIEP